MKKLLLALALFAPPPGFATPAPELICDPDAKITFQTRWFGPGSVEVSGEAKWNLPWTGQEPLTAGTQLKAAQVPGEANFLTFRSAEGNLYIEEPLYLGREDDGLVITEMPNAMHVLHCRSR